MSPRRGCTTPQPTISGLAADLDLDKACVTSFPGAHAVSPQPLPADYETDTRRRSGRLQTDRACSRWMVRRSRRGSRQVRSDRLDDHRKTKTRATTSERLGCSDPVSGRAQDV
jgi:hypothetical protein